MSIESKIDELIEALGTLTETAKILAEAMQRNAGADEDRDITAGEHRKIEDALAAKNDLPKIKPEGDEPEKKRKKDKNAPESNVVIHSDPAGPPEIGEDGIVEQGEVKARVAAKFAAFVNAKGKADAVALLKVFGAAKFSDVFAQDYDLFSKKIDEALGATAKVEEIRQAAAEIKSDINTPAAAVTLSREQVREVMLKVHTHESLGAETAANILDECGGAKKLTALAPEFFAKAVELAKKALAEVGVEV